MFDNHPGSNLKRLIDGKGITVKQAALEIGISHVMLYNIINAKSAITPEVAAQLELWCGDWTADVWLLVQSKHDLVKARPQAVLNKAEHDARQAAKETV
ncbi:XRE family plasmid maintenance system antidote protein [Caballeronia calidae]|uniref:XRE family plasmid maintenance system antidote protein n=1 Tax=Caballeronia calidae TaxID=1777139 RepID=A0A158DNI1_9BURK|nr:HigA family addiction module antitoxin [Caballeronia calidae]SAK95317.1 XRE family plasmid maintenance system antidote protein [Caballeronia calidae]